MAATYSWHPGADCVNPRWAVSVPLLQDEVISSWLVRAALTQGCDPLVLTGELWPKWRIWTCDPDRGLNEARLFVVAQFSGIAESTFKTACLHPIVSAVASRFNDDLPTWPWVLALGSRNRKRLAGLQYCPECLKEDRKPYFRVQWRLAWHTGCPKHSLRLLDRCFHCGATIEPHRLSALEGNVTICASCKRDLREAATASGEPDALAFQQAADHVVRNGHGLYGITNLHSNEWFTLSRYFVTLLRKVVLGKIAGLITLTKTLGVDMEAITPPATGLPLELLPVRERAELLAAAWRILEAGPERFREAAIAASLAASSLHERRQPVLPCIDSIISELPAKGVTTRSRNNRHKMPKPRSRQAVQRMWARFLRKMRIPLKVTDDTAAKVTGIPV